MTHESSSVTTDAPLLGVNVLLAEDGPYTQWFLSQVLRRAGATVVIAANGSEAVEQASARAFSVIVMDMQMPVMDGLTATRLLRSNGYDGRIIALTANSLDGCREQCLEAGCDVFATKPIDRRHLVDLVRHHAVAAPPANIAPADRGFGNGIGKVH